MPGERLHVSGSASFRDDEDLKLQRPVQLNNYGSPNNIARSIHPSLARPWGFPWPDSPVPQEKALPAAM